VETAGKILLAAAIVLAVFGAIPSGSRSSAWIVSPATKALRVHGTTVDP
jgi:hypothetical protein